MASQGKILLKSCLHVTAIIEVLKVIPVQLSDGNDTYSNFLISGLTLCFLAVWHGFHSGYYLTFFYEMLVVNFEKQVNNNIFNIARQLDK